MFLVFFEPKRFLMQLFQIITLHDLNSETYLSKIKQELWELGPQQYDIMSVTPPLSLQPYLRQKAK